MAGTVVDGPCVSSPHLNLHRELLHSTVSIAEALRVNNPKLEHLRVGSDGVGPIATDGGVNWVPRASDERRGSFYEHMRCGVKNISYDAEVVGL